MKGTIQRTKAFFSLGLLILMISVLLWQSRSLPEGAHMGYALLLGIIVLLCALAGKKESSRAFAGGAAHFVQSAVPSVRFSDVAANEEAMESLRATADELETMVGEKYWPYPIYEDLLFYV